MSDFKPGDKVKKVRPSGYIGSRYVMGTTLHGVVDSIDKDGTIWVKWKDPKMLKFEDPTNLVKESELNEFDYDTRYKEDPDEEFDNMRDIEYAAAEYAKETMGMHPYNIDKILPSILNKLKDKLKKKGKLDWFDISEEFKKLRYREKPNESISLKESGILNFNRTNIDTIKKYLDNRQVQNLENLSVGKSMFVKDDEGNRAEVTKATNSIYNIKKSTAVKPDVNPAGERE